jgi:hypothetical protein
MRPEYLPVKGKTYTLFGESESTAGYYKTIRILADKALALHPDSHDLVEKIRRFSRNKRNLKETPGIKDPGGLMAVILNLIDPYLRKYTENTQEHLRTLPLLKFWDRRLATTREQYHLYMLEIELTNRLFRSEFIKADRKIALMPYCLQDFSVSCKSSKADFDFQCRNCSATCFQNHSSLILKDHDIEPYIWMGGNMKQLAKYTIREKRSFGIIGIACIPELINGMRNVHKNNIPVIGIPLNANRCIRWFGEFFPNSVDLDELEKLLV